MPVPLVAYQRPESEAPRWVDASLMGGNRASGGGAAPGPTQAQQTEHQQRGGRRDRHIVPAGSELGGESIVDVLKGCVTRVAGEVHDIGGGQRVGDCPWQAEAGVGLRDVDGLAACGSARDDQLSGREAVCGRGCEDVDF